MDPAKIRLEFQVLPIVSKRGDSAHPVPKDTESFQKPVGVFCPVTTTEFLDPDDYTRRGTQDGEARVQVVRYSEQGECALSTEFLKVQMDSYFKRCKRLLNICYQQTNPKPSLCPNRIFQIE